jgi:hypothetical protein
MSSINMHKSCMGHAQSSDNVILMELHAEACQFFLMLNLYRPVLLNIRYVNFSL